MSAPTCTLAQLRQYVAQELGPFWAGTAAGDSTTGQIHDTAFPITSTLAQDDAWTDAWLLRPNAALASDRVRVVKQYTPSSGLLLPDAGWTNAPAAGEAYELHTIVEPATALLAALNEGLKRCLLVVEFTVPPLADQTRHSLATAAPWLQDTQDVRQVGYLAVNEVRDQADPYARAVRGHTDDDGGTFYLVHRYRTFNPTDTIYVRAVKRAYDHCAASGGSFGGQSGLSLDTDSAPVDLEWAGAAALVEVWRRTSQVLEDSSRGRLGLNRAEVASRFTLLSEQHFGSRLPPLTFTDLVYGGPRQATIGPFGRPW